MNATPQSEIEAARVVASKLVTEISKAYVGPPSVATALLTALIAKGHVLIEGIPGVAKTTLVKAFARCLGCGFGRIQFTPDLLPSDITGTYVLDMKTNDFVLRKGPLFTNIVLGDEINRAPAKTQSALLEAMQESQATIEGQTLALPSPFIVLATQNPVEHAGTYPLPEAQVDRFMMKLNMGYPDANEEKQMLATYNQPRQEVAAVFSPATILRYQELAESIYVAEENFDYTLGLVAFTRNHPRVFLGSSPRAALALLRAGKAHALLQGRHYLLPDDIRALAPMVLSHRIVVTPEAELEEFTGAQVLREAVERVPFRVPSPPVP